MTPSSPLERKLKREIAARKEAEYLLEQKGLALYEANQQLKVALKQLEKQTQTDLRKFDFEQEIDETLIHFGRAFLSRTLDDALLSSFLERLTSSDVINSAYINLNDFDLNTLVKYQFGKLEHAHSNDISTEMFWDDNTLHIPIKVDRKIIGELIFGVTLGDVDKDFIGNQMALVAELLCSAISRQVMMSVTIESRQRAEESEKATKEFVAMINHELRTPLNGLLGSAELIADTPLNNEQQSYLSNLTQSGNLLRTIINDLLDFSKMNAGMMELIPSQFRWRDLEKTINGIFVARAMEKRIRFSVVLQNQIPDELIGDLERISQILVNLVGNAIKFTNQGFVELVVSWSESTIKFVISDTGIGIKESAQATLFDPFVQADRSSKRNFEGSGLGLAICKQLVELMSGSITLESELGKGTKFHVEIPLIKAEKSLEDVQATISSEPKKPLESLKILVVDDIRMNQIIISQMLKKIEVVPDMGNNGIEALDAVASNDYDLIFMDCRMPEMDGFDATLRLRELGHTMPIIALTAGTTLEEREKCIQCGMDDILTKPYTASDLNAMLMKWN